MKNREPIPEQLGFEFPYSIYNETHVLVNKRCFLVKGIAHAWVIELLCQKTGLDIDEVVRKVADTSMNTVMQLSQEEVSKRTLDMLSKMAQRINTKSKGGCFKMSNSSSPYTIYSIEELTQIYGQNLEELSRGEKLFLIASICQYMMHCEPRPRISDEMYEIATSLNTRIPTKDREDLIEVMTIQLKRGIYKDGLSHAN